MPRASAARRARSTPAVSSAIPRRGDSNHGRRKRQVVDLGKWWILSGWSRAAASLKSAASFGLAAILTAAVIMLAASPAGAATEWRRVHKPAHSKHAARASTSGGPLYKGAL